MRKPARNGVAFVGLLNAGILVVDLAPTVGVEGPLAAANPPGWSVPTPLCVGDRIELGLDHAAEASISLFDVGGRQVRDVFEGRLDAGAHELTIPRQGGAR